MRTILFATAAVLIASPAFSTQPPTPPPFQGGNSTANAAAAANANAAAKAFQAQHQSQSTTVRNTNTNTNVNANVAHGGSARATGGQGGQGGNAASNATGYGGAGGQGGNSGPVSVNVDASSRDRTYAVGLPSYSAASGPCVGVSTSASVGVLGWAFGGGRTEIEDECQVREAARIAASIGMVPLAQDLIRSLPSVRKALASLNPPAPAPTAATTQRTAAAPAPACNGVWRNGVMLPQPAGC